MVDPISRMAIHDLDSKLPMSPPSNLYVSWGRYPRATHRGVLKPNWSDELRRFDSADAPMLPFGLGRSYGDSCLNNGGYLIDTAAMDQVLSFDPVSGRIRCAAGVTLETILQVAIPHGWFLPVTPGTKFVTIAGAIANDVHGKNHHCAGTIGRYITNFEILRSDGARLLCSSEQNSEWFAATVGGLGLTGVILWAELQLKKISSSRIALDVCSFKGLRGFLDITAEKEQAGVEYTVAWLDCFSGPDVRGIFFAGDHAQEGELVAKAPAHGTRIPFALPNFVLNRSVVGAFNEFYYFVKSRSKGKQQVDYDSFFYPLDAIRDWNLLYGANGLVQYQCVIPETEWEAFQELLRLISDSGQGSFLGVMKRFGKIPSPGLMSFPRPGLTLALDFQFRGERTLQLFKRLDETVMAVRGALYPAKDSRMGRKVFEASYPNLEKFSSFVDPYLSSGFWRRVRAQESR